MAFASWQQLVDEPAAERHIVQLYRDPSFLRRAVAAWVAASLRRGGGAALVCTPRNAALVLSTLRETGVDPDPPLRAGRLALVDADGLMARFVFDGVPDPAAFKPLAAGVLRGVREACGGEGEVRAWGEMVNLLWQRGNLPAAKRLEALWNEVIDEERIRLLCSYQVDNLAPETHEGLLKDVCCGHSRLLPEEDDHLFDLAVTRALADVFGEEDARTVRGLFAARQVIPLKMPPAEAVLVALHDLQPDLGRRVLRSARVHLASIGGA